MFFIPTFIYTRHYCSQP